MVDAYIAFSLCGVLPIRELSLLQSRSTVGNSDPMCETFELSRLMCEKIGVEGQVSFLAFASNGDIVCGLLEKKSVVCVCRIRVCDSSIVSSRVSDITPFESVQFLLQLSEDCLVFSTQDSATSGELVIVRLDPLRSSLLRDTRLYVWVRIFSSEPSLHDDVCDYFVKPQVQKKLVAEEDVQSSCVRVYHSSRQITSYVDRYTTFGKDDLERVVCVFSIAFENGSVSVSALLFLHKGCKVSLSDDSRLARCVYRGKNGDKACFYDVARARKLASTLSTPYIRTRFLLNSNSVIVVTLNKDGWVSVALLRSDKTFALHKFDVSNYPHVRQYADEILYGRKLYERPGLASIHDDYLTFISDDGFAQAMVYSLSSNRIVFVESRERLYESFNKNSFVRRVDGKIVSVVGEHALVVHGNFLNKT